MSIQFFRKLEQFFWVRRQQTGRRWSLNRGFFSEKWNTFFGQQTVDRQTLDPLQISKIFKLPLSFLKVDGQTEVFSQKNGTLFFGQQTVDRQTLDLLKILKIFKLPLSFLKVDGQMGRRRFFLRKMEHKAPTKHQQSISKALTKLPQSAHKAPLSTHLPVYLQK